MEGFKKFKIGVKVNVAECYLSDEVTENVEASKIATVDSEPSDNEELVTIIYESGTIDFVPQDILDVINTDDNGNCIFCGEECFKGEMCDEQQADGFNV